jgi:hypothetical protein
VKPILQTLREEIGKVYRSSPDDRGDPYSPHNWWIFDAKQTSPKTCPVCQSLEGSHYRGDEIQAAFPYHIQKTANKIKAKVHPHCRCLLVWTGYTKDVVTNPYGILKRKRERVTVPEKIDLSPSQSRMFRKVQKYSRETWKRKNRWKATRA